MKQGIYRTEESIMLPGQYSVFKGSDVLASHLTEKEADECLTKIIDKRREHLNEIRLDVETAEKVAMDDNFSPEKRNIASSKISKLMESFQDLQIEIGDL